MIVEKLYLGYLDDPRVFKIEETYSRLDSTEYPDQPSVFRVTELSRNDLDHTDPIIWFEEEYESYYTALLAFSTRLVEHANFLVDYHDAPRLVKEKQ